MTSNLAWPYHAKHFSITFPETCGNPHGLPVLWDPLPAQPTVFSRAPTKARCSAAQAGKARPGQMWVEARCERGGGKRWCCSTCGIAQSSGGAVMGSSTGFYPVINFAMVLPNFFLVSFTCFMLC